MVTKESPAKRMMLGARPEPVDASVFDNSAPVAYKPLPVNEIIPGPIVKQAETGVQPAAVQKERYQQFNFKMPESLYLRLKYFVEHHALRHESMAQIVVSGIEIKLSELEARAGINKG